MNKTTKPFFLTLTLLACILSSCNAKSSKTEESTTSMTTETPKAPVSAEDPNWKSTPGMYAEFTTSKGKIVCRLFFDKVPMTVANFVGLAEGKIPNGKKPDGTPFYDGLTFHRCIPDFMIQGGDPAGNGSGGPNYSFPDEFERSLRFDGPGVLAMANSGPATNGSQFFITHKETPWLNDKHSIFGRVVEGQSVVTSVQNGEVMSSVKIIRVGDAAQKFDAAAIFLPKLAEFKKKGEEKSKAMEEAQKKQKEDFKKQYSAKLDEVVKANAGYQAEWDKKVKAKFPNAKKTSTGLYYIIEKQGTGAKAEQFTNCKVHYKGVLWDGKQFDSSYDRGQPLDLMVGVGKVIFGWDEGIALLNQGGKGKLIIPYYLAYGDQAMGATIPSKSDLIFDVEVVEVK